jgi:hypothetical protein
MSTANRRCKGYLNIIAANQGYKTLLFVPWKIFQEKSLSAESYLLCLKAALSLDSKWSADICDKLVCYSNCPSKQTAVFQGCLRIRLVSRRKLECKFVIANGRLLRRSKIFVTVKNEPPIS